MEKKDWMNENAYLSTKTNSFPFFYLLFEGTLLRSAMPTRTSAVVATLACEVLQKKYLHYLSPCTFSTQKTASGLV